MKPAPRHDIPRSHMYSECLGGLVVCFKGQNAALHQLAVLLLPYREDSALLLSYRAYPDTEPILSLVMLVLVRLIVTPSDSNSPDRRDSWGSLGASRGCTERWACTALGACVAGWEFPHRGCRGRLEIEAGLGLGWCRGLSWLDSY